MKEVAVASGIWQMAGCFGSRLQWGKPCCHLSSADGQQIHLQRTKPGCLYFTAVAINTKCSIMFRFSRGFCCPRSSSVPQHRHSWLETAKQAGNIIYNVLRANKFGMANVQTNSWHPAGIIYLEPCFCPPEKGQYNIYIFFFTLVWETKSDHTYLCTYLHSYNIHSFCSKRK